MSEVPSYILPYWVSGSEVERRVPGDSVRLELPSSLAPFLSPHITALEYVLDGDTDRRLRGQVPRVTFLSRSPDDPKHQASGTMWLKHPHDRVCGDTMFQLQVAADPLASEGQCHDIIYSLISSSFPDTLTSHSEVLGFEKPLFWSDLFSYCPPVPPFKFWTPWRWRWEVPWSHLIFKALTPGFSVCTPVILHLSPLSP